MAKIDNFNLECKKCRSMDCELNINLDDGSPHYDSSCNVIIKCNNCGNKEHCG